MNNNPVHKQHKQTNKTKPNQTKQPKLNLTKHT